MKKITFYSEIAYIVGLIFIATGVVFTDKANYGFSMIVAPAYIIYRFINPMFNAFTFGMAEYCFQALLIIVMMIILRKFKVSYLLSIATALIYGFFLDRLMFISDFLPTTYEWQKILYFAFGIVITSAGVALMFNTYLSPEAYELFVKEIAIGFHLSIDKFKIIYDFGSLFLAIILSFILFGFGKFVGVSWGTIVITLVNGAGISLCSKLYRKIWVFKDALPWRPFFMDQTSNEDKKVENE